MEEKRLNLQYEEGYLQGLEKALEMIEIIYKDKSQVISELITAQKSVLNHIFTLLCIKCNNIYCSIL